MDKRCQALRDSYDSGGQEGYLRKRLEFLLADNRSGRGVASCYARLGETEKALAELEAHIDEPQEWQQLKFIAMYDSLRDEPRFKALLRRARLEP